MSILDETSAVWLKKIFQHFSFLLGGDTTPTLPMAFVHTKYMYYSKKKDRSKNWIIMLLLRLLNYFYNILYESNNNVLQLMNWCIGTYYTFNGEVEKNNKDAVKAYLLRDMPI